MSPPRRNFLLYGLPRCGSTPVYLLLKELFSKLYGLEGLSEYFNQPYLQCVDMGDGISVENKKAPQLWGSEGFAEAHLRLALLRKYPNRYFFKLLAGHTFPSVENSLLEEHEWIFLERRDRFSQVLSYLIARERDVWYEEKPIWSQARSFVAKKKQFDGFELFFLRYQKVKSQVRSQTLYYEDFCELDHLGFLKKAGYRVPLECNFSAASGVQIQNPPNKLALFSNPEEIKSWYADSFLRQYPHT